MIGLAPLAAIPLAGWWAPASPPAPPILLPSELVAGDVVWLLQPGTQPSAAAEAAPAPLGVQFIALFGAY